MITVERRDAVAIVAIDRPDRHNALDGEHCRLLRETLTGLAGADAQDPVRAVVLTGAGRSFCSGADLTGVYDDAFRSELAALLRTFAALPVPVIAAVNGPAIGAGTQLAIACDLRVGAPRARFAVPTARNGLAVDPWTVQRLVALAGGATARALLLGCDTLDLDLALARGLVDRRGELDVALAWAQDVATMAPLTLAYSKPAVDAVPGAPPSDPVLLAAFERCWASQDVVEGRRARAEGRAPHFTGR